MRIDSIYLRDVGPFDEVTIPFPEGKDPDLADVYLLTGPNGCGKSTVLYAIAALVGGLPHLIVNRMRSAGSRLGISAAGHEQSIVRNAGRSDAGFSNVNVLQSDLGIPVAWAAFAYAGSRELGNGHVAAITELRDRPIAESLSFNRTGHTVVIAQWIANQNLKRLMAKEAGQLERASYFERSRHDIESVVRKIIDDPTFAFVDGFEADIDIRVRHVGRVIDMGVLPDGIKSIVSWVADLLMRLDRIPWIDDTPPMQRSFLLLLDEIDIHLHPDWQRKVLPVVQKLFPNAQIIATTHSPFVVASAADAHVVTFAMKDGVSTLASVEESQTGRSYRAILHDIFGVTSEFDVATEKLFGEFYAAKAHLFENGTVDRTTVDRLAHELARRGEEIADIMGLEMRQLERQLAKRAAG